MAQKFRKKTLLAKLESTYGVDPTPTGAANAIQTKDLTIMPLEGEVLERGNDKDSLGADTGSMVGKHVKISFKVEVAGAGTAGSLPAYHPLLIACGHSHTVSAGVSVTYVPIDDAASLALYFKHDKVLHKIFGARGSVRLVTGKRKYAYLEFEFIGLYTTPEEHLTSLGPVLTAFVRPVPFRAANVEFELFGALMCLHELTMNFGQTNALFECSEAETIELDDRKASFDAKFTEPLLSVHNYYDDADDDIEDELSYVHGTVAGNIVEFVAPNAQIQKIGVDNEQGNKVLATSGPLARVGSTEYSIIVR